MVSIDTNLFVYAQNTGCGMCPAAFSRLQVDRIYIIGSSVDEGKPTNNNNNNKALS